jgi:quercetin dioxygenase-like cupin family protein
MKKIEVPVSFQDKRGDIIDLLQDEKIDAVTLITFEKNAVRANHFHQATTQWNYVLSGAIKIAGQMPEKEVEEIIMNAGDMVVTIPHERHALKALEKSTLLVLTKGPRGGKEYESDTFRLEKPLLT